MLAGGLRRIVSSLVAVLAIGTVIALVDANFAVRAEGVPPVSAAAAAFSLFAVYAGLLALAVAAAAWVVSPSAAARAAPAEPRGANVALWPCLALAGLFWLLLTARIARAVLVGQSPSATQGALLALAATGLLWAHLSVALALGRQLSVSALAQRVSPRTGPWVAAALLLVGFAALVVGGQTSGAGGAWSMFGVLRRAELDLRAPALAFAWAGASLLLVRSQRVGHAPTRVQALLALVLLGGAVLGYRAWDDEVTFGLRRSAPLTRVLLGPIWRLGDGDGDGASAWFGGGDCDDANPARHPGAIDAVGNGIDEDCSGRDEVSSAAVADAEAEQQEPAGLQIPEGLSVVLITVDTLRADLGYLGYARPISPNLDRLVTRSVLFEQAYSLASYTGKSLGPSLIGRYPSETKRNFGHFDKFTEENAFIQDRLHQAGVRTISVQGHWYMEEASGLGRGYDVLDTSAAPRVPQGEGDRSVTSEKLTDAAIARLQEVIAGKQRFFLWVHYLDPHAEYVPHEEHQFGRKQRDLYDGEIAYTDAHVGRLLDFIQSSPLRDSTALVVTSDHGEAFGEHGLIRHGFELWQELVRVPLIVHVPSLAPRRLKQARSTIDLVPTLLDLYRLPLPAKDAPDFLSGHSLVPDLLRPGTDPAPERPVFIDMCAGPYNDERQALIDGGIKIITAMGRPVGIYNLEQDPGEKDNLLKDATLRDEMKAKLASFRATLKVVPAKK